MAGTDRNLEALNGPALDVTFQERRWRFVVRPAPGTAIGDAWHLEGPDAQFVPARPYFADEPRVILEQRLRDWLSEWVFVSAARIIRVGSVVWTVRRERRRVQPPGTLVVVPRSPPVARIVFDSSDGRHAALTALIDGLSFVTMPARRLRELIRLALRAARGSRRP